MWIKGRGETCGHNLLIVPCVKVVRRNGISITEIFSIELLPVQCPKCPYLAKNKNCLQSHVSRRHPGTQGLNYDHYAVYRND